MNKTLRIVLLVCASLAIVLMLAFNNNKSASPTQQIAKSIKISHQEWMPQNLNVDRFRNGDVIPQAKTDQEWQQYNQQGKPAWCYYENLEANGAKYGRMYNWYAVNDKRGLAPEGWRIPIDRDWADLGHTLGSEEIAGYAMKATSGWNEGGNGSNSSKFNGVPGGYRHYNGQFSSAGDNGFWWSADMYDADNANASYLSKSLENLYRNYFNRGYGFSVRCIKE